MERLLVEAGVLLLPVEHHPDLRDIIRSPKATRRHDSQGIMTARAGSGTAVYAKTD